MVVCASADARADQEMLASAKSLYESASYEAALSEFSAIHTSELADTVDTYKALCLLGLGRVRDAEQALELVVTRQPMLVLNDTEYSPRVVALFRDVRKKALPAAAQQLYTAARTDYENKKYDAAAAGFKQALQVIADIGPGVADDDAGRSEGTVERLRHACRRQDRGAGCTSSASGGGSGGAHGCCRGDRSGVLHAGRYRRHSACDCGAADPGMDVHGYAPNRVFSGTLEVLIDEKGSVETATLAEPVWPPYDLVLLSAAKRWQYQPAVRQGKPVKFKRMLVINIEAGTQRPR